MFALSSPQACYVIQSNQNHKMISTLAVFLLSASKAFAAEESLEIVTKHNYKLTFKQPFALGQNNSVPDFNLGGSKSPDQLNPS